MLNVERRTRRGLYWQMEGPHDSLINGFSPDDLATKSLVEADDVQERVFISIREILEKAESSCLDDEEERLTLCHRISTWVYQNRRKII